MGGGGGGGGGGVAAGIKVMKLDWTYSSSGLKSTLAYFIKGAPYSNKHVLKVLKPIKSCTV